MKKKIIISAIVTILLICIGVCFYIYHSNQVKAERINKYNKALFDFRATENRLMYGTKFIVRDYLANWHGSICNKKALDRNNIVVDCANFEKALSMRQRFYSDFGANYIIDSTYNVLGKKMEIIRQNAEEEHLDVVRTCQYIFQELGNAITLTQEPSGSYMEYSTNTNSCFRKLANYDKLLAQKVTINTDYIAKMGRLDMTDFVGAQFLVNSTDKKSKTIKLTKREFERSSSLTDISWRLQNVDY